MTDATEKQVIRLKKFVKDNPDLSKGILKGIQFDDLGMAEASELIKKCYDYEKGVADDNSEHDSDVSSEFRVRFSQNYRNGNGAFGTVSLTDEELAEIRTAHKDHCQQVMEDCEEDYPDNRELQLAMFDKRADKIFTWIQQALDEKVRKTRGGSNGS